MIGWLKRLIYGYCHQCDGSGIKGHVRSTIFGPHIPVTCRECGGKG